METQQRVCASGSTWEGQASEGEILIQAFVNDTTANTPLKQTSAATSLEFYGFYEPYCLVRGPNPRSDPYNTQQECRKMTALYFGFW